MTPAPERAWPAVLVAVVAACAGGPDPAPVVAPEAADPAGEETPAVLPAPDAEPAVADVDDLARDDGPTSGTDPWVELRRNAVRANFPRSAAREARADLERGMPSGLPRAAALYTVGAAGGLADRPWLEQAYAEAEGIEQAAALFGLSELPEPPVELLIATASEGGLLGPAGTLGLLLADDPAAREHVDGWIQRGGARAERLVQMRTRLADLSSADHEPTLEMLLRLRWEAAKRYGLVGGQDWRGIQMRARLDDAEFLDEVVLRALDDASAHSLGDHLASLLIERPSPGVVRGAVRMLPTELDDLMNYGLWTPGDDEAWNALLSEIERVGPSLAVRTILDRALAREASRLRAAALWLRLGGESEVEAAWEVLAPRLTSDDPSVRGQVVDALAASGDPEWLTELERLETDSSPVVTAKVLVARVRLGDALAEPALQKILADPDGPSFEAAVRALAEPVERHAGLKFLRTLAPELSGDLALAARLALARDGDSASLDALRAALDAGTAGELAAPCVEVLGRSPDPDDIDRFTRLYPSDDTDTDLSLVSALVANQTPLGKELLRGALWRDDFDRGVLAAIALADRGGLNELWDELEVPPRDADAGDLRRLGYAIGLLGGVSQVERLARTRPLSDPVMQGVYLGALASRTR